MFHSKKPSIIIVLILSLLFSAFQTTQALTFTEVVNLLQAPDINLPTGVTNPKGNIGFILANLFWGTADGTKNGKIKPQYLDYSGISSWTQSGTITYLTASTGSVGIGTPNPGEYSTAIRGIDDTATIGALWVSGQTATTPGLMVRNDGNVGIGTASPQAPLQVNGPATSGVQYVMNVIGGAALAWTDGAAIKIGPTTAGQFGSRIVSYSNASASYGSRLQLQTHDTSSTNQSFNTGLLIDENGNVGIGTVSPNLGAWEGLYIKSNVQPNAKIILEQGWLSGWMNFSNNSNWLYFNSAREIGFWPQNINTMTLTGGNVGIGTTNPGSRLQVAGNAYVTGYVQGGTAIIQAWTSKAIFGSNGSSIPILITRDTVDTGTDLYISSTGNVGIGTTAPASKLQVSWATTSTVFQIYPISARPSATSPELYQPVSGHLGIATNDAERIRIDANGNVGIGTASPTSQLHINGVWGSELVPMTNIQNTGDGWGFNVQTIATTQDKIIANFSNNNGSVLRIRGDGNVWIGTTAPAYKLQVMWSVASNSTVLTSDRRFKKNITPITSALDAIEKLRWVTFDWKIGEFTNRNFPEGKQIGFIAQDVEKVLPEVVTTDNDGYKWVEYANITAVLVEAVRELKSQKDSEIGELKRQNEKLLKRVEKLEKK